MDQNLLCGGDQSAHFKPCLKQEPEKEKQVKVVRHPQNRLNSVKKWQKRLQLRTNLNNFHLVLCNDCHGNLKPEIKLLSDLSDTEQTVLKMRAEIPMYDILVTNICRFHELNFGEYLERKQTKFCNILDRHVYSSKTTRRVNGQHSISLEMAINLQNRNLSCVETATQK